MKLRSPPRRESPETIIALIDVVFFLLIFFMLIGRMDATAPFDVMPATAQTGSDMPGGGATVAISSKGALALDGAPADREALIKNLVRALQQTPDLLIRINAHRDAELRHILPFVAEIEAAGARDIVLVVTPTLP